MYKDELDIRVRYGETDKMGQVYYGYYSLYYEQCRTEAIRKLGTSYKTLEDSGILMPVTRLEIKYIKGAKYDEILKIHTVVPEMPGKKIIFQHEIYNEGEDLINKAEVQLLFVDSENKKVISIPENIKKQLTPYFE